MHPYSSSDVAALKTGQGRDKKNISSDSVCQKFTYIHVYVKTLVFHMPRLDGSHQKIDSIRSFRSKEKESIDLLVLSHLMF